MSLSILARGEGWVVVAKPPRLLVHRAEEGPEEAAYALQLVRDLVGTHVHPIHRLDRPTSGCLLFGLDKGWARDLQAALGSEEAEKVYLAFVRGRWQHGDAVVRVDRPMTNSRGHEREALSFVRCLATSAEPRCSLLEVHPRTGRYHQVRRHVRDLSHPILGDSQHGDTRVNRWWREHFALPRLGLHCLSLRLPLPDGTWLEATCPPFEDLAALWRRMPWWADATARRPELTLPPLPLPDYALPDARPTDDLRRAGDGLAGP